MKQKEDQEDLGTQVFNKLDMDKRKIVLLIAILFSAFAQMIAGNLLVTALILLAMITMIVYNKMEYDYITGQLKSSHKINVHAEMIHASVIFCKLAPKTKGEEFLALWVRYLANTIRLIETNNKKHDTSDFDIIEVVKSSVRGVVYEVSDIGPSYTALMINGFLTVSEHIGEVDKSLAKAIETYLNDAYEVHKYLKEKEQ